MSIPFDFVRSHGLGNDYLVMDSTRLGFELTPERIRLICDRNKGVGSDGILAVAQNPNADFFKSYQLYSFIDRGTVWNRSGNDDRLSLSSAGGGVRLYFAGALQADLAIAGKNTFQHQLIHDVTST